MKDNDSCGRLGNQEYLERFYSKTLEDFRNLDVISLLGYLHGECLSGRASDREIGDFLMGINRTKFIAAGYGKQLMLREGCALDLANEVADEISNHSPIAQMSIDARLQFGDGRGDPFDTIKMEAESLFKAGGLMAELMLKGQSEFAKKIWMDGVKGVFHSP